MARLRSAVAKAKDATIEAAASLAANASETISTPIKTSKRQPLSLKASKSQLPVPQTPAKSPSPEISYPSLEKLTAEMVTPRPKSGSSIPAPPKTAARKPIATQESPSPVKKLTAPSDLLKPLVPDDKPLPTTPSNRGQESDIEDPSSAIPGAFTIPKSFNFQSPLPKPSFLTSRPILPPPSTPRRIVSNIGASATTGGKRDIKKRFEAAHEAAFAKMDSIANHYAARRTPQTTIKTPQNPQKGLKRMKEHTSPTKDEENQPLSSPSPVKKAPEPPAKRQRLDSKPTITINKATPSTKSRYSNIGSTTASRRPSSKLPTTPSSRLRLSSTSQAPHTIAPTTRLFPSAPTHIPGSLTPSIPRPKTSPTKTTPTTFTFTSRPAGHKSFKRLSDMHDRALSRPSSSNIPKRILIEEVSEIDDPFGGDVGDGRGGGDGGTTTKQLLDKAASVSKRAEEILRGVKRRAGEGMGVIPEADDEVDEDVVDKVVQEVLKEVGGNKTPTATPSPPQNLGRDAKTPKVKVQVKTMKTKTPPTTAAAGRKRAKLDPAATAATTTVTPGDMASKTPQRLSTRRLDALATPKRRNEAGVKAVMRERAKRGRVGK
ncbi:hypothetical protein EX30DRAFT_373270 [Ascodesmis nigricans]|uniref:Uncharacterized protein n=1 Tax=Ascodesmis nigricans TaxID=341454 RepID=A0A4S2MPN8_9PEZI|nr:hypothetical protein EX30DRAFT_373270 [Ascodesmis nigricans]